MFHVKQSKMKNVRNICEVCGSPKFSHYLTVKDYFLSGEVFEIVQCTVCGFRYTNPRPPENEMERYYSSDDYISHNAQKITLTTTLYKAARFFAIRNKFGIIKDFSPGEKILDIGCGTGELLNYCAGKGYRVQGVELNDRARNFAQNSYHLTIAKNLTDLTASAEKFDVITLWHVLEHFYMLNRPLQIVKEVLLPGGVLIIALPNCNSWDAKHYKEHWAAYDIPRHLSHFSYPTFKLLAFRNGFEVIKLIPQKLDAFYISLLSEQYIKGRKNFLKAFMNGIRSNFYGTKDPLNHSSLIYILKRKIS
jgi:2-polyprenyl-3-methyl-5-hydroxy-6-metoxy-1,4-benzoquinol methylase